MRVVIRGLILSAGMDELGDDIRATFTNWLFAPFLTWRIKRQKPKVVDIIGHSLGANAALRMANELGRAKIKVGFVCMLDPTVNQVIVHGKKRTAYQSSDFRAKRIDNAQNISVDHLNHMSMTYDPEILRYIKDNLS